MPVNVGSGCEQPPQQALASPSSKQPSARRLASPYSAIRRCKLGIPHLPKWPAAIRAITGCCRLDATAQKPILRLTTLTVLMRTAPLFLLLLAPGLASAEMIYRCEGDNGHITYQNHACSPSTSSSAALSVSAGYIADERQRQQRLSKQNTDLESERIRRLLKPTFERREAQYAENRKRCEEARQVAAICGKHAGTFTCNLKGFRLRDSSQFDATPLDTTVSIHRYETEQCALRVSKGRS